MVNNLKLWDMSVENKNYLKASYRISKDSARKTGPLPYSLSQSGSQYSHYSSRGFNKKDKDTVYFMKKALLGQKAGSPESYGIHSSSSPLGKLSLASTAREGFGGSTTRSKDNTGRGAKEFLTESSFQNKTQLKFYGQEKTDKFEDRPFSSQIEDSAQEKDFAMSNDFYMKNLKAKKTSKPSFEKR